MGWDAPVKVVVWDGTLQRKVIKEMPAIEVIRNPEHVQFEAIVSALCKCVAGLVDVKQQEIDRIRKMMGEG
jgi:hypothetical protein